MFRIFTYLTLDVNGLPTAAGTYFDPSLIDDDANTGNNLIISPVRDGTRRYLKDPMPQYEVEGSFLINTAQVDLQSGSLYLGAYRYLGPVLYYHHRMGLPICLFKRNILETHSKAFLCYLRECDNVLVGQSTINTDERVALHRNTMPKTLQFQYEILYDGIFTDPDDITTAVWNARDSV
jgi:hypothetical protein